MTVTLVDVAELCCRREVSDPHRRIAEFPGRQAQSHSWELERGNSRGCVVEMRVAGSLARPGWEQAKHKLAQEDTIEISSLKREGLGTH